MTRIAMPIKNDVLSKHFTQCSHYVIYELEEGEHGFAYKMKAEAQPLGNLLWTQKWQVTDVIANTMEEKLVGYFADTKINLFIGVAIDSPEHIIEEYAKGELRSNTKTINN